MFILAIGILYFYGLGRVPLLGPDEPRYAQVAREMYERGDMITPTLGGHVWFEKPALLYWMMMGAYAVFGVSEFAARFGSACSGLITLAALFWVAKRVERACGDDERPRGLAQWTTLAGATTIGLLAFARGASFDIVVTMTITVALACFFVAQIETEQRKRNLLHMAFYAAIGASLLAKGLVGIVIPFGVVGLYFVALRRMPDRRLLLSMIWGVPLALAVASVWYGPAIRRHGWLFIDEFFIQHHFARFVSNKYHHPQPIYFYIIVIVALGLPWSGFLFASIKGIREWGWGKLDPRTRFRVFALAWLIAPIAFFSIANSKLPGYILPALPGAILLGGDALGSFLRGEGGTRVLRIKGALLILLAPLVYLYAMSEQLVSTGRVLAVIAPMTIAGLIALLAAHMRRFSVAAIVVGALLTVVLSVNLVLDTVGNRESIRALIKIANERGYQTAPVYGLHTTDQTAEFYAPGRVAHEKDGTPVRFEGPQQVAEAARQRGGPVLAIVPVEYAKQLTEYAPIDTDVMGNNGTVALVAVVGK